ncbi:hypothetical protein PENARI_c043G01425 [Penicillium arizonense]|uniref:cAMP-independent regulatory protein pac2 n=1 Tax=Penicillium arizonense TaxID=1835702 RepID=A0A1F5L3I1_PENAI|nr:hypothetical protein PENARI_c043G01425 [Penicillium arizonense]OGE47481.1 hypothetical protein PENARI_c043G01425 [Penicillium arizonense]
METYYGHVRTPADAIILLEACRIGILPRTQRRCSEKERQSIRSGSVFVWDEREAGMRRWTDGKSWSACRVSGSFLKYREMEGRRGGGNISQSAVSRAGLTSERTKDSDEGRGDGTDEKPDGYRYKPDGLVKQSFSITTSTGQHLHLISYYSRSHPSAANLQQPTIDPALRHVRPQKGLYPESTADDQQNLLMATRGTMVGAAACPIIPPPVPSYARTTHVLSYTPPSYAWPRTSLTTPPTVAISPYSARFYLLPVSSAARGLPGPPGAPPYDHQQHKSLPHPALHSHAHALPPPSYRMPYERPHPESALPPGGRSAAAPSGYRGRSPRSVHEIPPQQRSPRDCGPVAADPCLDSSRVLAAADPSPNGVVYGSPHLLNQTPPSAPQLLGPIGTLPKPTEAANGVPPHRRIDEWTSLAPITSSNVPTGRPRSPPGDRPPIGGEGPRDIPNEKISFDGEDIRALRQLNRVFIYNFDLVSSPLKNLLSSEIPAYWPHLHQI